MRTIQRQGWWWGGLAVLALCGCDQLWKGLQRPADRMSAGDLGPGGAGDLGASMGLDMAAGTTYVDVPYSGPQKNVDILFMIDNSPSMTPKQNALATAIPKFIQFIDSLGADYHIGITTSDVGSTTMPGGTWNQGLGLACEKYEGDDGTLQRIPCTQRSFRTPDGTTDCKNLCPDDTFVPANGAGYISKVRGQTNVPVSMDPMTGKDIGPQRAFQCMALVADNGCGIEGQLEGARRALDGHNMMNMGFFRSSSVLAIIFITDEDDCSVQLARRAENSPDPPKDPSQCVVDGHNKNAPYDCFNADYRCLAMDAQCDTATIDEGQHSNCTERTGSYLEPITTYVNFFNALRPPNMLVIAGIWSPSIDNGGRFVTVQYDSTRGSQGLNRAADANAACVNVTDNTIIGKPQLRLHKFAASFRNSLEVSVCDTDHYTDALSAIANVIKTRLYNCVPFVPKVESGQPACQVGDVDDRTPNALPAVTFPVCSALCCNAWAAASFPTKDDPGIVAACTAEAADCFCALPSTAGVCSGGAVLGVWRKGGGDGPGNKVPRVRCVP